MERVTAEHRYLSILFCDMMDSSVQQYRMDPEQFAQLLVAYRSVVFDVVRRHGGHVARVIGDGILAYFGWPRASGHDAQAAVSCALEIGAAMPRLATLHGIQAVEEIGARMAIETGWVLVGAIGAGDSFADRAVEPETDGVVGHAPNVAARLQRLAARNGVVVGEETLTLLGQRFELEPVDTTDLPLPAPVRAARILGRSLATDLLHRMASSDHAPLVGREEEREALWAAWQQAVQGRGQVVLLSGEPGMGKSRLAAGMATAVQNDAHLLAILCSASMTNSALQPLAEPIRLAAGLLPANAAADVVQAAAGRLVEGYGVKLGPDAIAALLGAPRQGLNPQDLRRATFEVLRTHIVRLAAERPLLLLVEDLHWADATTLDLLHHLSEVIGAHRVLLLATHRADAAIAWPEDRPALRLVLARLSDESAAGLLAEIGADLDAETRDSILRRADGNPFFLEEFARAVAGQGDGRTRLPGSISQLLNARLDSVGPARDVAERVAAYGREIELPALRLLAEREGTTLEDELDMLLRSRIMTSRGDGNEARYTFRHALLAEAAYEALTRARRLALHQRIARMLEAHLPGIGTMEPEFLGHHCAHAGEHERAATLFRAASLNALSMAALGEAEGHARQGIGLAEQLTGDMRQRALLGATILLGESLSGRQGYASSEVRAVFERASRIALELGGTSEMQPALRGLTAFYQIRGPLHRAHELGRRAVQVARVGKDPLVLADAERRWGWCRFCQGELDEARLLVESAVSRVERVAAAQDAPLVDDTVVRGPGILALIAWLVDGRAAALELVADAASKAEQFPRPVGKCYSLGFASFVYQLCGEVQEAHRLASMSGEVASKHGNTYWLSLSDVVCGWADVMTTPQAPEAGMALLRRGIAQYEATESNLLFPYALLLLAQGEHGGGQPEAALATLDKARGVAEEIGAQFYLPILGAERGQILLRQDRRLALETLGEARGWAIQQGALALVARIDLTIARSESAQWGVEAESILPSLSVAHTV